ncbi:threonine-phosphate decarboxylase CobD [Marinobacter fonticola]|uniref:threonine-phosphate decarboxylase CobD n=1 Tax=Marinobacter fonticola TaxID=2603215 RepID=UPI0011E731AA|nr:threonine-phosphate decarboxylase CobD [Marinobacter fonticola]
MDSGQPLHHGGRLGEAARQWDIPREKWLDLSTGINPVGWPVPTIPDSIWQRLPEDDDGLVDTVRAWCDTPPTAGCLPVAGSQAAIQTLPRLRKPCRVGVPYPAYEEHARCWSQAGHTVVSIDPLTASEEEDWLEGLDVLVWINPNNPTGRQWARSQLLGWHERLQARGGWLVVDEAFLLPDDRDDSLTPVSDRPGLLVLKSLGKFFGLAGVRAGAVLGDSTVTTRLAVELGPWSISHPARFLMKQALADTAWQTKTCARLRRDAARLDALLQAFGTSVSGTALFRYVAFDGAHAVADHLAQQGILVRRFSNPAALRFGLPGDEPQWLRLEAALAHVPCPQTSSSR